MNKPNILITNNTIHINFDGRHFAINKSDKVHNEIRTLIKEDRLEDIPEVLNRKNTNIAEYIEGSGFVLKNGSLHDSDGNALPAVLSNRLQELKSEGFKVDSLVNFWKNLKDNPSMNSREQLYKFLEQNGHPITPDGHFIAYRGVSKELKDCHTGKFDNSPGSVCEMPRKDVDDNPNKTCSQGLHVAAFQYANGFGPVTVEVKVNPRDVVAVPADYNGQKMRVCRFEVIDVCKSQSSAIVYGYDHKTWDDIEEVEEGLDPDIVDHILSAAIDFKDRYKDRATLATRIEEEIDGYWGESVSVADILQVLNENEADWND